MIAPKHVSHVQPTGYDFSDRTSPDLITGVPLGGSARAKLVELIESLGLGTDMVSELQITAESDCAVVHAIVLQFDEGAWQSVVKRIEVSW